MSPAPRPKGFLEIPAVSILKKTIVVAQGNKYETLTIDNKVPDALDLLELITEKYETIYVTDLSGLLDGKPQVEFIHKLAGFCNVWVDSGVINSENIYDLFVAGAEEVILSSKTINGLIEVARAYELSENLIFQIDYDEGILSQNMQLQSMPIEHLVRELKDIGIKRVIFADLSRIGSRKRLNVPIISELLRTGSRVYVGGGVKHGDVSSLKGLGTAGALLELVDVLKYGKVEL
jgi:phosphoribosylformimino-5-aminoimidazole carboxamide ribotide isomerase